MSLCPHGYTLNLGCPDCGLLEKMILRSISRAHNIAQDIRDAAIMRGMQKLNLQRGGFNWRLDRASRGMSSEDFDVFRDTMAE